MSVPHVPDGLISKIKSRDCALFVGSGLSCAAGLPSWKQLMARLIDRHYANQPRSREKQALLEMAESDRLIDLAELIKTLVRPKPFRDTLVEMIDPPDIQLTETHRTLAKIPFSAVITTNYDHLLEETYSKLHGGRYPRSYTYTNMSALANLVAERKFFIFKAHGSIADPDTLIFSRSDYQQLMFNSPAYRAFFSSMFISRTFLFVGYSLSDPDLAMVLENLSSVFKGFSQTHYLLLPDPGEFERDLLERRFNIEVIPYIPSTDKHPEVCVFLERIQGHLEAEKEREIEQQRQAQVADRLAAVSELTAGVAHELNNPLTSIIGFSDLLLNYQKDIPSDIKEYVDIINREGKRAAAITRSLLTFARRREPSVEPVDVNDCIRAVLSLRAYAQKVNNISVTTRFAAEPPIIMAGSFDLQQVFLNIILNAEYFMTEAHRRGNLTITTEKVANTIRASFSDDGPGIPVENIDHIFDPFFSTKGIRGTGLGLSICYGIVTGHNGRIYARNNQGSGTTFVVELPLSRQSEEPGSSKEAPETERAREVKPPAATKILAVDDERAILKMLDNILTAEGYTVHTASNAIDALQLLKSNRYDVMLLDIRMPGMSGIELYDRVVETDPSLAQRVILITGAILSLDIRDYFSKSGAHYLTKPFTAKELRTYINEILSQNQ